MSGFALVVVFGKRLLLVAVSTMQLEAVGREKICEESSGDSTTIGADESFGTASYVW